MKKSMFPICRGNVWNYVLHKLAHLPTSKEDVALKFSVILSFLCLRNILFTLVQYVN